MTLTELRRVAVEAAGYKNMYGTDWPPFAEHFDEYTCLELLDLLDEMAEYSQRVMNLLEENGSGIVPHLLDSDENAGSGLRQTLAKYNAWKDGR